MIKVNEGKCSISGEVAELLAETTVLLKNMRTVLTEAGLTVEEADKRIDDCLTHSRWTLEELLMNTAKLVIKALADEDKAEEVRE